MTKMKFEIKSNIVDNMSDKVSELESRESFNYKAIDIDNIIANPKNFYAIENIEELSEDIELNGLLHNLVVKALPDGKYRIISGERRYRAILQLVGKGNLKYKKAPCQIMDPNDLDEELLLIQGNAQGRDRTDNEKLKEVEKLTAIYKAKKEKGEKVPGRVRELVASDLGLSTTQVGRYETINRGLIEPLKQLIEEEKLSVSNASEFATLSEEMQMKVYEYLKESAELTKNEALSLKKELQQKDDSIKKIKDELSEIEKEKEKMEEQSKAALEEVSNLKSEKEQLESEISSKTAEESQDKVTDIELLKSKLKDAEQRQKEVEEKLNNLDNSNYKNLEDNTEIIVKLKELRNSFSTIKFRTSSLKNSKDINIIPEVTSTYKSIKNDIKQFEYDMDKYLLEDKE